MPSQPPKREYWERAKPQFCGWAGTMWHPAPLWSARGSVLAVPAPSLLPAPWGTELRSRESLDTLQALFSNTFNTGVLSAHFELQAGKVQVAMKQLTPPQPAPAHSFISRSFLFPFPSAAICCLLSHSSAPWRCLLPYYILSMILHIAAVPKRSWQRHQCICAPRQAGRGSGEPCKYILNCVG